MGATGKLPLPFGTLADSGERPHDEPCDDSTHLLTKPRIAWSPVKRVRHPQCERTAARIPNAAANSRTGLGAGISFAPPNADTQ
jgi:hypothetical protein